MLATLTTQATEMLTMLFVALVGYALLRASQWINAHTKNAYVRAVVERLDGAVMDAVKEAEQTTVKAVREAAADGSISAAEAATIKADVAARVRDLLGQRGVDALTRVIDPKALEAMIHAKIEAAVLDLKPQPVLAQETTTVATGDAVTTTITASEK